MKFPLNVFFLLFLAYGCTEPKEETDLRADQFTTELSELKEFFQIPGLAVSIDQNGSNIYRDYLGVSDRAQNLAVDSTTLFPIASITKVFTGVVILKLVEEGKLSLESPINTFFPNPVLGDTILVKHVLSHTSQGEVGEHFYYSSRFGLLTTVIEKATGQSFAEVMDEKIFTPLKLQNTFLLKDSTQIARLAKPYILDNGIEAGFIDYGYSASAGIVSNLQDLAVFNKALDQNLMITQQSKELMFTPSREGLPYGYGIFHQEFEGLKMIWAYGQYDCYSSLLLKIPSEQLTLTILANNSLLSDPARLIYGDASASLFVLSFLKNYVFEYTEIPLLEKQDSITEYEAYHSFIQEKHLTQALSESFMARYEPDKRHLSAALLKTVFTQHPNYLKYADLDLLHNLSFLKDIAFYMELGEFNDFDTPIERIGAQLLKQEPNHPYVHSYLGTFYARKGKTDKAKYHFEQIVNTPNFSKNWYTNEAQSWLRENNE